MNEEAAPSNAQPEKTGLKQPMDIPVPPSDVQRLKWSTPDDIRASINSLYLYSERHAQESIAWYARNKGRKASVSRTLRAWTILLTTLGGLAPILSSLGWQQVSVQKLGFNFYVGQLGYLFLGLAAACIGLDKFFGFSSGWMRYITTMMTLERALSEFRFGWAMMVAKLGEQDPSPDQVQLMIQRLKEFSVAVSAQLDQETQAWVSEFKTNLAEIEKTAKAQAEAARPGAISVTVTNGMETEDGFTVALDGMEVKRVHGTKYQIGYVPPGTHKIGVTGKVKGEQLDAHELVNVTPGAISSVTLALPVKEAQP
jgi:hypothetical protein